MIKLNSNDPEIWENALISVIKKELGISAVKVVKNRLFEKYGTTIRQSFHKWELVEDILKENFGDGYIKINSKFLAKITATDWKYGQTPFEPKNKKNEIIKIIGDPEVGKMLDQVLRKSKIIKDIIDKANVPQTTAYRKIERMKQAGLLVEDGFIFSDNNKKIVKYTSPFSSFAIIHENGKASIKYGPKKLFKTNLFFLGKYNHLM